MFQTEAVNGPSRSAELLLSLRSIVRKMVRTVLLGGSLQNSGVPASASWGGRGQRWSTALSERLLEASTTEDNESNVTGLQAGTLWEILKHDSGQCQDGVRDPLERIQGFIYSWNELRGVRKAYKGKTRQL